MRDINAIIVHCAATKPSMDIGVAEIKRWHTDPKPKGRGWSDIGYHYIIRRNGVIERGRPEEETGAHAKGYNANSIGVCLVGGLNNKGEADSNFTAIQFETLWSLIFRLLKKYPEADLMGHRDVSSKTCPNFDVAAFYERSRD